MELLTVLIFNELKMRGLFLLVPGRFLNQSARSLMKKSYPQCHHEDWFLV